MSATALTTRATGPGPETEIVRDLVRRGLLVAPAPLALGALFWGTAGLASVALALALVLGNLVAAAALQSWAARISYALVMGVALGGFLIRIGIIAAVVFAVSGASWVAPMPLGLTLIIGHLGLLVWETRHLSISLAFPGLKPDPIKE